MDVREKRGNGGRIWEYTVGSRRKRNARMPEEGVRKRRVSEVRGGKKECGEWEGETEKGETRKEKGGLCRDEKGRRRRVKKQRQIKMDGGEKRMGAGGK